MFYVSVGPVGCALSIVVSKFIAMLALINFANKHFDYSE
jgi:Na+-driven multidrug efflux pump